MKEELSDCAKECILSNKKCTQTECRAWIDYKKDFNCSVIAVKKNGDMTLDQVSKRLNLSIVRIKQIQDKALQKLQKKRHLKALRLIT